VLLSQDANKRLSGAMKMQANLNIGGRFKRSRDDIRGERHRARGGAVHGSQFAVHGSPLNAGHERTDGTDVTYGTYAMVACRQTNVPDACNREPRTANREL
jgi:hypothetical protein